MRASAITHLSSAFGRLSPNFLRCEADFGRFSRIVAARFERRLASKEDLEAIIISPLRDCSHNAGSGRTRKALSRRGSDHLSLMDIIKTRHWPISLTSPTFLIDTSRHQRLDDALIFLN